MSFVTRILLVLPLALVSTCSWGQAIELSDAVVVVRGDTPALSTVATVLEEEVRRRTGLHWERAAVVPPERACIEIALSAESVPGPERFTLKANPEGRIQLIGADPRGALFGAGYLLRKLDWKQGAVALSGPFTVTEKPEYAVRGHQLGYRARANSWDAWTPAQFDQYIRELALFGTNAIENIPFEDDRESPHFKLFALEENWDGPIRHNGAIEGTLSLWRSQQPRPSEAWLIKQ